MSQNHLDLVAGPVHRNAMAATGIRQCNAQLEAAGFEIVMTVNDGEPKNESLAGQASRVHYCETHALLLVCPVEYLESDADAEPSLSASAAS